MKSLFNEIKNLQHWDYYEREDNLQKRNWNNISEHQSFIKSFLKISAKESIENHFFTEDLKQKGVSIENFDRAIHTNSVFFIGCLLYKKLSLKDKINFVRKDKKGDEFHFVWFLTSLVHDFGYFAEKDKSKFPDINNCVNSISRQHNLLSYIGNNKYLNHAYTTYRKETRNIIDYIPRYFKEAFEGKRSSRKEQKIEHGIYAGLLLYDGLVKNRIEKKEQSDSSRYWKDDLDKFYAIASFAIAIHNMRRGGIVDNPDDLKFTIDNEPYLFLFGLVDSIEPTKIFDCVDAEYVMKNILIDVSENTIILKNSSKSKLDFSKVVSKIDDLSSWLDVEVCTTKNLLTIEINQ